MPDSLAKRLYKENSFFASLAVELSDEVKKEAIYLATFRAVLLKDKLKREELETLIERYN